MITSSNVLWEKKKLLFQLIFSTYLPMGLLKFLTGTLIRCKIWFLIQGVPMFHTFNGLWYMKSAIAITFFHVFIIFCVARFIESMQHGYSLDEESNFASNECSRSKFDLIHREISWKYVLKKYFFFFFPSKRWWCNLILFYYFHY